jgi:hypothetical protein
LAHQALLNGSEEELLAGTVTFIRDGLECGDPIRVVTTDRNTGWLRAALGGDAGHVAFVQSSQWYRHPVRALAAAHRTVQIGGSPPGVCSAVCWTQPGSSHNPADSAGVHVVGEFVVEAAVTPGGVLLCQAWHQSPDLVGDRWAV